MNKNILILRNNMILVTNYEKKLFGVSIDTIENIKTWNFNPLNNELIINNSLSVGVFEEVPQMRRIKCNEDWFKRNIYHLK